LGRICRGGGEWRRREFVGDDMKRREFVEKGICREGNL